ncbi:MAG TPA: hypothetical protein VN688_24650 [Gemmataceae bacterium]|nr:hypothetical protein [Gemmataceae bacterium]
MTRNDYQKSVFINCPFDNQYRPLFDALIFAVLTCGFRPRCALEIDDASEVRIEKIFKIIAACRYGIHDISRIETNIQSGLPRFNMPLELGLFLAAKRFGTGRQAKKACLVLDSLPYRYQQFISDIAGQDIQAHHNDPVEVITVIRNWLRGYSPEAAILGGTEINRRYLLFTQELPALCERLKWQPEELTFIDYAQLVSRWLELQTSPEV